MNTPTPTPRTDSEITLTGTYTCTHHNDAERTACPVCLVTELTAERDQLRAQLRALTLICGTNDANKFETWIDRANARAERAEAELATERARMDYIDALSPNDAWVICSTGPFAMAHLRAGDPRTLRILPGIRAAIDAAMREGAK